MVKLSVHKIKTTIQKEKQYKLSDGENAHIESFNSILEIKFFQPRYFNIYGQAYRETVNFIEFYISKRIHGSLKKKTPVEVCGLLKSGIEFKLPTVEV